MTSTAWCRLASSSSLVAILRAGCSNSKATEFDGLICVQPDLRLNRPRCRYDCTNTFHTVVKSNSPVLNWAPTNHSAAHCSSAPLTEWTNHSLIHSKEMSSPSQYAWSRTLVFPRLGKDHFPALNQQSWLLRDTLRVTETEDSKKPFFPEVWD